MFLSYACIAIIRSKPNAAIMTDTEALELNKAGLRKALKSVGTGSALARMMKITPSAVLQWEQVPADRVLEVERLTGVSRYELRPDICGDDPRATEQQAA